MTDTFVLLGIDPDLLVSHLNEEVGELWDFAKSVATRSKS
jgi:hypothetical protein